LTNEELATHIKRGENDLIPLLWEQCIRFIKSRARKYIKAFLRESGDARGCELDDLVQQSYFALLAAINAFDESVGYKFLSMLDFPLRTAFAEVMGFRTARIKNDPLYNALSLDMPVNEERDSAMYDFLPDETTEGAGSIEELATHDLYIQQLHETLELSLARLSAQQQDVLRKRYYENLTCAQVAEMKGITPQGVNSVEGNALAKLYASREITGLSEFLEQRTNYYKGVGPFAFKESWESAVERIVIKREMLAERWAKKYRSVLAARDWIRQQDAEGRKEYERSHHDGGA
jgi:RNA polymerase sigma factor (sigma-70 family)